MQTLNVILVAAALVTGGNFSDNSARRGGHRVAGRDRSGIKRAVTTRVRAEPMPITAERPAAGGLSPTEPRTLEQAPVEPANAIRQALRHRRPFFEECFTRELRRQGTFSGFFILSLDVSEEGQVSQVRIEEANTRETPVGACIAFHVRRLKLPRLTSEAKLILPIQLEAMRSGPPEPEAALVELSQR